MKICVAQTKPVKGDMQRNIDQHILLINLAVTNGATTIIFPELSLTGYKPTLAKKLATNQDDHRFNVFQEISDASRVTIGVGVPTKNNAGICISMVIFEPHKIKRLYSKKFLHADEEPFFVPGQNTITLTGNKNNDIALAICYEISVTEHVENAFKSGAAIYIASVAKSVNGISNALTTLSNIAHKYSMTVLMSNCIGLCDGDECAGKTSIWNNQGLLLAQLNDTSEGILIIDTHTQEIIEKAL